MLQQVARARHTERSVTRVGERHRGADRNRQRRRNHRASRGRVFGGRGRAVRARHVDSIGRHRTLGRVVHRATPGNGPRRRRLGAAGHDDRIRPRARRVDRVAAELEHPDRVAVRRLRVRLVAGHRCQRDVLHAVDHVGDRGGLAREARLEAPQHIAGRRVHGG